MHRLAEAAEPLGDGPQVPKSGLHLVRDRRVPRKAGGGLVEGLRPSVQPRERPEPFPPGRVRPLQQVVDLGLGLALQGREQRRLPRVVEGRPAGEPPEHPEVPHVDVGPLDPGRAEHLEHEADRLHVALHPRVAVDLRPHLDGAARARHPVGPGVQHRARVAEPDRHALPREPMGVDPGRLGGHVRPHPEHPPRRLVGHLEGAEIEVGAGAVEERVEVFEEGGHHQLVPPRGEQVDDAAAEVFQPPRVGRQHLFDPGRQQPRAGSGSHGSTAQVEEDDPRQHARQARDPERAITELVHALEQPTNRGGAEKGHDAFQDEQKRDRFEQAAPHDPGGAATSPAFRSARPHSLAPLRGSPRPRPGRDRRSSVASPARPGAPPRRPCDESR